MSYYSQIRPMKSVLTLSAFLISITMPGIHAQDTERFGLRLIAVRTQAEAIHLLDRLNAGQQFADLAQRYSADPSGRDGGYVGTVAVGDLLPEFQQALSGVEPGRLSRIVRVGQFYFLLQRSPGEENRARELMKAATNRDAAALKRLIDAGADVNHRFENGVTVLMNASFAGNVDVVKLLLTAGADANASLGNASTALMAASLGGHAAVVRALIDAGANVKTRTNTGATALTEASHAGYTDVVRILLAAGAEVNTALNNGSTPLMAAALGGHADVIRVLVDAGAELSAKDSGGRTALTHAASSVKTEAVKALIAAGAAGEKEGHIVMGTTYVNEYYVSNATSLLEQAAAEFQRSLDADPQNAVALEWMGAIEILRWSDNPSLQQFSRANSFLKKAVALDAKDPVRHYWLSAASWKFASGAKTASNAEISAILDEGIEHARKAIELDPKYSSAMAYLSLLYRARADRTLDAAERTRLLKLSNTASEDMVKSGNRPPRPNDQFSRPSAPPPPQLK